MLVKKYANRRLYDTMASRYITLEELAERIRTGADVRVLDAKTNEDLTQATLTQVILESRGAARMLPVGLLTQLIRMNDDNLAEFLGRYLSWALEMYVAAKNGAQAISPYAPLAMTPFNAASAFARLLSGGWSEPQQAPPPPPPPSPAPAANDVAELRRELDALKQHLKKRRR